MKKIFFLLLILISISSIEVASSTNLKKDSYYNKEEKQTKLLQDFKIFKEYSKVNSKFAEEYAGAYFDEDHNLVVNVKNGKKSKFESENALSKDFIVVEVDYSIQELKSAIKTLSVLLDGETLLAIERDDSQNSIIIYTYGDYAYIENEINQVTDFKNVIIKHRDSIFENKLTATRYIVNGTSITVEDYGANTSTPLTVGFGAKNSNGEVGVVTAGHHGAPDGSDTYCDSYFGRCGDVKDSIFGGSVDASFVKLRSTIFTTYKPSRSLPNNEFYNNVYVNDDILDDVYVQNTIVRFYGDDSGATTGKILSLDYTDSVGGVTISSGVKCDYKAVNGDSGGPVTVWFYLGGYTASKTVIGIQSYSYLENWAWVDGTSYSVFTRSDFILDELDLTPVY